MPSSRPQIIPAVLEVVRSLQPRSILDVGVGFGKWGHLFREYTDIKASEHDPQRYDKSHWQVRIDGIEGHAAYITDMHRYLYDNLYEGDATKVLPKLGEYDFIFMGDVIEHLEKAEGTQLLQTAYAKARQAVLVSTPKFDTAQGPVCNNPLERHRSLWAARDFKKFTGCMIRTIRRETILALLVKPGLPARLWDAVFHHGPKSPPGMRGAIETLTKEIPRSETFVLIDEEQIRSLLPHWKAVPFLEKDGAYWGPPSQDQEAIECLERLKAEGAHYLALVWTTWWWLERFPEWGRHVRTHYRLVVDDSHVRIFDLKRGP